MTDFNLLELTELTEIPMQMILWGTIVVLAAIIELNTFALVSLWFVIGGIAAFVAAYFDVAFLWQFAIFVLTSGVIGIIMIPYVKKRNSSYTPTNTDSLVGHEGITESELNVVTGSGRAMVDGQSWAAKSVTGVNIPADTVIVIEKIEGVTLFVRPKPYV